MLSTLFVMAILGLAKADYIGSGVPATFYYDLTNTICTDPGATTGGGKWALGPNSVAAYCEPNAGYQTYNQLGTNSIVAFREDMVHGDPAAWCGKQVQIFDASGKELQGPNGPFYIWDGCAACLGDNHLDLSGEAWAALGGNCDQGANPTISYKVLDNNIRQWAKDSPAAQGPEAQSASPLPSTVVNVATSAQVQVQSAAAVPAAGSCTTKGPYQCSGLTLQQCNYVGQPAVLDWQTITTSCASYCDVSRTPICG